MVKEYDDYDIIFTRWIIMMLLSCIVGGLYNIIIEEGAVGFGLVSSYVMVVGVAFSILYLVVAVQLKKYQLSGIKVLPRMKIKLKIFIFLLIGNAEKANEYHLLLEV